VPTVGESEAPAEGGAEGGEAQPDS
jgi:hypothetical protein